MGNTDDEYVSMHHRIRRDLRKRLKHVSAEHERPVTDIVNQAIEEALVRIEERAPLLKPTQRLSVAQKVARLREASQVGRYFEEVTSYDKRDMVQIAHSLGMQADVRLSGDRLTSLIKSMIGE